MDHINSILSYKYLRKHVLPRFEIVRNVNAVVFVYDVTKPCSFESLPAWIEECDRHRLSTHEVPRILVGNKCDCTAEVRIFNKLNIEFPRFLSLDYLAYITKRLLNLPNSTDLDRYTSFEPVSFAGAFTYPRNKPSKNALWTTTQN